MQTSCQIQLLGDLRVVQGERVITRFQTQKTGALLAYLACFRQRPHARELLITLLWPAAAPEAGRNSLSVALSSLRNQLESPDAPAGSVVQADRQTVQLHPAVETDAAAFEIALASAAASKEDAIRKQFYAEATMRYTGPLLPDYYEDWIAPERERLAERFFDAGRRLAALHVKSGHAAQAIELARRLTALDPLRENTHTDLMRLLAATGRTAEALRLYGELERRLAQQLNAAPERAARNLARELQQKQTPPDHAVNVSDAPSPALPAEADYMGRVPAAFNRFWGREQELKEIKDLLAPENNNAPVRLLTLTGQGGAGKTRLALEAAANLRQAMKGAVWFLPLADLTDAKLLPETLLRTLGLSPVAGENPLANSAALLRRQPSLLILDNCEHLIEAAANLAYNLLSNVPNLRILAASRQRLDLSAEREFPLPPLAMPDGTELESLRSIASVQLFVDRAQAVRPDFEITARNARDIAELCTRLEGLPLALELAAARVQTLTAGQMLSQWEQRLDFLVSRRRDVSERHKTLRAAVDWSYRLLAPDLQKFFATLCIFRGGCTQEAAEAICVQTLAREYLAELREASLLVTEERGEAMRFRMVGTLREFARERIAPTEYSALAQRHADYYREKTEAVWLAGRGGFDADYIQWMKDELENWRAALDWYRGAGQAQNWLQLAGAVGRFWQIASHYGEARAHLEAVLSHPDSETQNGWRARALQQLGLLVSHQDGGAAAQIYYEEALTICREENDRHSQASILRCLAWVTEDSATAWTRYEESLSIYREIAFTPGLAVLLNDMGVKKRIEGDYEAAQNLHRESLKLYEALQSKWGIALAAANLGEDARYLGSAATAEACLRASLLVFQEIGEQRHIAETYNSLALIALDKREHREAWGCLLEAMHICHRTLNPNSFTETLARMGLVASGQGRAELAAQIWGALAVLRERLGVPLTAGERREYERAAAVSREQISAVDFERAWQSGRALSWEQAVAMLSAAAL